MCTNSFIYTVCRFADGTPSRRALRAACSFKCYKLLRAGRHVVPCDPPTEVFYNVLKLWVFSFTTNTLFSCFMKNFAWQV